MDRRHSRFARTLALLLALAALTTGCAQDGTPPPAGPVITVWAASDANRNTPVALDVVAVQDERALEALEALTATEWFATRSAVLAHLHGRADVVSREIEPGRRLVIRRLPTGYDAALATVVYAAFTSEGVHRARAPGGARILIELNRNGFTLSHDRPSGRP